MPRQLSSLRLSFSNLCDGDFELSESSVQTRSRRISFSSTVSETFVFKGVLTEGIVKAAEEFWRSKGLAVQRIRKQEGASDKEDPVTVEIVAEGGTIWTTNFDSYKKTVNVDMRSGLEQTEVFVHMVLPGGLMSLQDRERAASLIGSFYEALQANISG